MTFKPYVVPANNEHAALIAPHLRDIDQREIWAAGAFLPYDALIYSLENSTHSFTILFEDRPVPVAMFGIGRRAGLTHPAKCIWLLATDEIRHIRKSFIKKAGSYLDLMAGDDLVYNYVMEGNAASLKWLSMLGFTIMEPRPHGWLQKPFHYVKRQVPCVQSQAQH